MATLKAILDAMMAESGFALPSGYANSLNPADVQLVALANAASDELRELGLTGGRAFGTITLTTAKDYALPADFLSLVPDTAWGDALPANEQVPSSEWAMLRATGLGGPWVNARVIGTNLQVLNPSAGTVIRYEYLTAYPWSASGTAKELATADTDEFLLDRRALTACIKWRWKKEKGLPDWQADYQSAESIKRAVRGRNARTVLLGDATEWSGAPQTSVVTC